MRPRKDIQPVDMLNALGKIYGKTATGYATLSLYAIFRDTSASISRKRRSISIALVKMKLLIKAGKKHLYRWNMQKYGAPDLTIAKDVIRQMWMVERMYADKALAKSRRKTMQAFSFSLYKPKHPKGCSACPYVGTNACAVFADLGIKCQEYDLNSIRNETSVG